MSAVDLYLEIDGKPSGFRYVTRMQTRNLSAKIGNSTFKLLVTARLIESIGNQRGNNYLSVHQQLRLSDSEVYYNMNIKYRYMKAFWTKSSTFV